MEFSRDVYLNKLISRRNDHLIKVITGVRRAGKSYLLDTIFRRYLIQNGFNEENIISFSFDSDDDVDQLRSFYPDEELYVKDEIGNPYVNARKFRAWLKQRINNSNDFIILLDEVQLLERFTGTLNSLLKHGNLDIYVTGSNSKFLSSDIATEFRGRESVIHVLPLSFHEFMSGKSVSNEEGWREYIVTGGIPLVAGMTSREEKEDYLINLCTETYLKDILQRNSIKKGEELSELFDVLASISGSQVSTLKLANTFESMENKTLHRDTINNYIHYFEEAFLISCPKKYDIKGRKYIASPYKIYFEDNGIRNARLNFRQIEETHLMENIIYNELRYRGFKVDTGQEDIYEENGKLDKNGRKIYTQKKLEVDFVAVKGSQKYYIQSALNMDSSEKKEQEKRSLQVINDSFKKIIVTKNNLNPFIDENGILTVDLFDFLLKPELIY